MLILWDIDGTLVDTRGAGPEAFCEAAREFFAREIPSLDFGGATDAGLLRDLAAGFGLQAPEGEGLARFLEIYELKLEAAMKAHDFEGHVHAGAESLLDALSRVDGVHQSLLTGNARSGARIKLESFGLWQRLEHQTGAYGDEDPDRGHLAGLALQRSSQALGRVLEPAEQVWVIGDTVRDIACAKAIGARCAAVATGSVGLEALQRAGADWVGACLSELPPELLY